MPSLNAHINTCCFLCFRFLEIKLVQKNHAVISAATRVHVLTEALALSYVTTPNTSSTAHAGQNISADFVKSKERYLVKSRSRNTHGASRGCINCLIQQRTLCMKSSAISQPRIDLSGHWLSRSAWLITNILRTRHFTKTFL